MNRFSLYFLSTILITTLLFGFNNPAMAAQSVIVRDVDSRSLFNDKILFHAAIDPGVELDEFLVSFTPQGQITRLEKMQIVGSEAFYEVAVNQLNFEIDASPIRLAPFTRIEYSFEAHVSSGEKIVSDRYTLFYEDTRFTWQSQKSGIFEVAWNDAEDLTLGQEIINVAIMGLENAQSILQVDPPNPLRVYAYSSSADLQEALMLAEASWVAGHASPDLGMILISIPSGPEKKLELQRQVPHEIMHLLQYQVTGSNFIRQPMWLIEGMASVAELYPNPEYRRVLEDTTRSDNLIAMDSLCLSFPTDAGPAFRSYAQSESFVRFLLSIYGNDGLRELMENYQNGLSCTEAVSTTFGSSLGQLEYRWKEEELGLNAGGLAVRRLSPYLLLGLLILIPAGLSIWPLKSIGQASSTPSTEREDKNK